MTPFIVLIVLLAFIGLTAWIIEVKILPAAPIAEPWNWIIRIVFWAAVIFVLWKYAYPQVIAIVG